MRLLLATVLAVVALIALSIVSMAAASGGRQSAVAVGGVHDVTHVDHHWKTIHVR
jgi:hypothetical protein